MGARGSGASLVVDEVMKFRVAEARHWLVSRVDGAVPERACEALIEADARIDQLEALVARAAHIAEHLMQMIPRETWRAHGADDGQGHYEGDYREEQTFQEIQSWKEAVPNG